MGPRSESAADDAQESAEADFQPPDTWRPQERQSVRTAKERGERVAHFVFSVRCASYDTKVVFACILSGSFAGGSL